MPGLPARHGERSGTRQSDRRTYCIDATEVTVAAYGAFLATNPSTMTLPASCSMKTSFVPGAPLDLNRGNYPVSQVDWCDAWGYCAAVGKHLCGRIGGGNTLGAIRSQRR